MGHAVTHHKEQYPGYISNSLPTASLAKGYCEMLRSQYGVAMSSSATPVSHAEDAQPNETIYKRRHGLPPQIGSTWKNNHRGSGIRRGSYDGPWTQHGIRGSSGRGRGNFQSNRGSHNSNQRQTGHVQRSTHVSAPPIATLPDIEYHVPQTSSSSSSPSSSQIKASRQLSMPDSPVIRESRWSQTDPDEVRVRPFSAPILSECQPVDDYHWLHRSRSPSPKLPPSSLKRRKLEHQPAQVSDLGRNEDSVISQPKANKPLLPGRYRRFKGSAPIPALPSSEPLVQAQTEAVSPVKSNISAETPIKQEPRTPSPARSLRVERSLITSSCKFYPIPESCKKPHPDFRDRRKVFFNEKMQELSRLGLKGTKSFFRDDGLVIEWKSKVPVWSDTLLPEFPDLASAIKRAYQINHLTSVKSSPKRKRQSVDQQSREFSLKNNNKASEPNEAKYPRHTLERAAEIEMVELPTAPVRISSSPTPRPSLDHGGDRPSTNVIPLSNTPELICLDPEVVPHIPYDADLGDVEPLNSVTSVTQQQNSSAMDVDTSASTQPAKPVRRMLFKPVHPLRRNQPTSSVQDSTLPTSDFAKSFSTSLSAAAEGHSEKDETQANSRPQDDIPSQEKMTLPRPRPPLPSPRCRHTSHGPTQSYPSPIPQLLPTVIQRTFTHASSKSRTSTPPTLPPPLHTQIAEEVDVKKARASSKDEDYGNTTDPDTELVVNLLLRGTPEEPNNCLSSSGQEGIVEDLPLYEDEKDDKDDEPSVSVEEDTTAVVEGLATQFLQRYVQLFDVDRLKLETAYARNALFSCRVHHVQEPSFSMAGLFAPECPSNESRQGFNMSRCRASMPSIQKGRAQIVNRLLELGPHSFCPRGVPRTVTYDVVPLSSASGGGILLTVHGEVVNPHLAGPQMDHVLSVDQSFVLRKKELEDEDEDEGIHGFGQTLFSTAANNLWPLVAVSHQMTVRDVALLPLEQLDSLASQIQGF